MGTVMGTGCGMGWMWIFWLLLVLGAVLLIVLAIRAVGGGLRPDTTTSSRHDGRPGRSGARQTLDERYARGELTTEEYRERLQALSEDG